MLPLELLLIVKISCPNMAILKTDMYVKEPKFYAAGTFDFWYFDSAVKQMSINKLAP